MPENKKFIVAEKDGKRYFLPAAEVARWKNEFPHYYDICEGPDGRLVAVGEGIYTSDDGGENWTRRYVPAAAAGGYLRRVVYGGDIYMAAGDGGKILTSFDGVNWTHRPQSVYTGSITELVYANGSWVIAWRYVDNSSTYAVSYIRSAHSEDDGGKWSSAVNIYNVSSSSSYTYNAYLRGLVSVGDRLAAVVERHRVNTSNTVTTYCYVYYSDNGGANWSSAGNFISYLGATPNEPMSAEVANGIMFVFSSTKQHLMTSTDGTSWTALTFPSAGTGVIRHVIYANGLYVALGDSGTLFTSADGATWVKRTNISTLNIQNAVYSARSGKVCAVGENGLVALAADVTGTWESSGGPVSVSTNIHNVRRCNGLWVAVGDGGTILTSADGEKWTKQNSGVSVVLFEAAYGNGVYVAVGNGGTILWSADAKTWTKATSGVSGSLQRVVFGNGVFVACGGSNSLTMSTDGKAWTARSASGNFYAAAYGDGVFVIAGDSNAVYTSPDGVTWTARSAAGNWRSAVYADGAFIIGDTSGKIARSRNGGVSWTAITSGLSVWIDDLTFAEGMLVAACISGGIYTAVYPDKWQKRGVGVTNRGVVSVCYDPASKRTAIGGDSGLLMITEI